MIQYFSSIAIKLLSYTPQSSSLSTFAMIHCLTFEMSSSVLTTSCLGIWEWPPCISYFWPPPHKTYKKIIFTGVCDVWMYHFTQEDKLLLVFESESTFFYWFHRNFSASVDTFSNKSKFLTTSLKILIRSYFMHLCFIFLYYYFLNKLYILYWNIWLNAKF